MASWWMILLAPLAALAVPATTVRAQAAGEMDVVPELDQFGVGNAYRPGDTTGIRLILTSALDEPTPCWVQWEVPNAEGDVAEYGRQVTVNPGQPKPVWLYAPLPPQTTSQTIWTVRVFEWRDERRRRELGGAKISPGLSAATRHELEMGMIAVVGRARMRLEDYTNTWNRRSNPPGAHEETRIISGVEPQEMPDRWEAFKPFEAVVWSNALPQQLGVDAANALREYVRRGGHLVIVLPEAGNPWGLGSRIAQIWLDDLLVQEAPRKDEGVMLSQLMPVLSKSREPPLRDFEVSIRVFGEIGRDDDRDNFYEPLIALPDGRVVAVQRLVDFGRITLVGMDLASQRLASMRLPQGDVLWNRVLGRRADTPQPDELAAMDGRDPSRLTRGSANELVIGDSRIFEPHINRPGQAETGLLAALLLFAAYLFLAGPLGFVLLKQRGLVRHSWLAFAGTAAVFTAVAWGGVRLLRQHDTVLRHVTFLDHVVRPPEQVSADDPHYQRAVSWGSLYLPSYGTVRVAIDSDPMQRDLLLTWAAPERLSERFPNVDRYMIDVGRSLADYEIPARATATQLYADWMGALDPEWGGTLRVDPDDPVRVRPGPGGTPSLSGTLLNELPGDLLYIRAFWVGNTRLRPREYLLEDKELAWVPPNRSGEMLNTGHMWAPVAGDPWYPGTELSLSSFRFTGQTSLQNNIYQSYIEGEEGDGFDLRGMGRSGSGLKYPRTRDFIEMLSIFHQLTPPRYIRQGNKEPETVVVSRKLGRELDLSPWFNRPCLILIGYLERSAIPVPLRVDDQTPDSEGITVLRWIYPLPLDDKQIVGETAPDRGRGWLPAPGGRRPGSGR